MSPVAIVPAAAVLAGAVLAGALLGISGVVTVQPWLWGFGCLCVVALVNAWTGWPRLTIAIVACACASGAAAHGARDREAALHPPLRHLLDGVYGQFAIESWGPEGSHEPLMTRFRLIEDASRSGEVVQFPAEAVAVKIAGRWHAAAGAGVRVSVSGAVSDRRLLEWRAGRTLMAPATFRRPARFFDRGVPDAEWDSAFRGVTLLATVKSGLLVSVEHAGSWLEERGADVRLRVRRAVARDVAGRDALAAAVTAAVLIGDRTGLPDDVRERLQAAGVYHVLAISGGNIAMLSGAVLLLLACVGIRGRAAAGLALAVLIGYSQVVSAGPSVWRATLMGVVYLAARSLDHRSAPWHAPALALAVLVVARPLDLRDPGFILTFGASAVLIEMAHRLGTWGRAPRHSRRSGSSPWAAVSSLPGSWLATSLLASAAVEVALMPVSAQLFSRITVAGLVLNLVAVPMMAVVQLGGLAVVALHWWPWAADIASRITVLGAWVLLESTRLVDVVPWLARRVPPPGAAVLVVYYAALAAVCGRWRRLRPVGVVVVVAAAVAIALRIDAARLLWRGDTPAGVRLVVFDVGQAESMLLQTPAGAMVIDAAGAPFGGGASEIGPRVLAPALWALGIRALDTLVVTHADPDHVGGAQTLLDTFAGAALWTGVDVPSHGPTQQLLQLARRAGRETVVQRRGDARDWGGIRVRVLHPPEPDWERQRVRNDDSVVLELRYGQVAMLLTGDISADVEREIVPHLIDAPIRILKVAHHGSRTSTSGELLAAWRPQVALLSCGRGNRFGHPAPDVMARLVDAGAQVFRTDRDGQIVVDSNGRTVTVTTFAGGRLVLP